MSYDIFYSLISPQLPSLIFILPCRCPLTTCLPYVSGHLPFSTYQKHNYSCYSLKPTHLGLSCLCMLNFHNEKYHLFSLRSNQDCTFTVQLSRKIPLPFSGILLLELLLISLYTQHVCLYFYSESSWGQSCILLHLCLKLHTCFN